jgi:hypothetical protein
MESKEVRTMFNHKPLTAAVGVAALAILLGVSAHAWQMTASSLTFSGPVALPGVTLGAGTYIFERADLDKPDIVRVRSKDRKDVYLTVFTRSVRRPDALPKDHVIELGETASGVAPRIKAWFPIDETLGHEFVYNNR